MISLPLANSHENKQRVPSHCRLSRPCGPSLPPRWRRCLSPGNGGTDNTDPQQYYRFYTGSDNAFIGSPMIGPAWASQRRLLGDDDLADVLHQRYPRSSRRRLNSRLLLGNSRRAQAMSPRSPGLPDRGLGRVLGLLHPADSHFRQHRGLPGPHVPSNSDYVARRSITTAAQPRRQERHIEHPVLLRGRRDDDGDVLQL